MKPTTPLRLLSFALLLVLLVGCAAAAPARATLADIPVYPEAVQLKPGESAIADTLAQNVQTAAGMGQELEQQMSTLPAGTAWDDVAQFYAEKLDAAGWRKADLPVPANQMMQMALYTRGTQSLTVAQLTAPMDQGTFLLLSLASQ